MTQKNIRATFAKIILYSKLQNLNWCSLMIFQCMPNFFSEKLQKNEASTKFLKDEQCYKKTFISHYGFTNFRGDGFQHDLSKEITRTQKINIIYLYFNK